MNFANAPVSKGLIIEIGLVSLIAGTFGRKHLFHLPISPHLSRDHQFWRLISHHFAYTNSSEVFLSILLLFNISIVIERLFGTLKFASFIAVSALLSTILEALTLFVGSGLGLTGLPAGPYGVVFAVVYQYYRIIPATYRFKVAGFSISNKAFTYFLAVQLMACQTPHSVISSICGILAGALYRADVFGLRSYRFSPLIQRLASRCLLPLIGSTRSPRRSNRTQLEDPPALGVASAFSRSAFGGGMTNNEGPAPTPRRPEGANTPSALREWTEAFAGTAQGRRAPTGTPEQVASLRGMFPNASEADVTFALSRSNGDINRAVEYLLTAS